MNHGIMMHDLDVRYSLLFMHSSSSLKGSVLVLIDSDLEVASGTGVSKPSNR